MKADLHLHTNASDGKLSPDELVRQAAELGVEVIAITDHDSVEAIPPALEAARSFPQLTVIPGVEINTDTPEGEVHVLGYFVDYRDARLNQTLLELRNSRLDRGRKMVSKLAGMGIEIEWERVLELAAGGALGRPHVARAMVERGYVSSFRQAFTDYIRRNGPAYVQRKKLTPLEAVNVVLEADGLPVLAHPAAIQRLDPLLSELAKAGMAGIEVYYNGYSERTIADFERLARKYDLIACGGSDYHGLDDSVGASIGSVDLPRESVERLFQLAMK
jgi:predicted metal-dependent phosphoesterase TrpH